MSAHASVHRARSVLGAGVARTQIVRGRIAALPASAVSFCFNFKAHGRGRREFILKYSQILRCAVGLHGDFLIFPFWRKERILQVTQILTQETVDLLWLETSCCLGFWEGEGPMFLFMRDSPFSLFFPFFYPFFSFLYCITMLLPPTLPSWAWLSSSAYCAAFPLLCHSLVCSGSSKVKSTETLISEALAHSALEIRILVHYTQLLAEQSSVTGKHNAGARGSDLEL